MSRVRNFLPHKVMLMLYYTLIHPYLSYCNIIWGSAKFSVLHKLEVLQKRAVRLCTGSKYLATTSPLFKRLRILKICDINKLQIITFMFKIKHELLPEACMHYVNVVDANNSHNLRKKFFFKLNKFRTNIREHSIAIRGPKLWNLLPDIIQNSCTIGVLKRLLITNYLDSY